MADLSIQPTATMYAGSNSVSGSTKTDGKETSSFGSVLDQSIHAVNRIQQEADDRASQLVTGESTDIHGTMVTMQKAEISMSLLMEVRNKVISAYDEIKRMQF